MGSRTVSLAIRPVPGQPPSRRFEALPWFPGERVLDLLVLADASAEDRFTFRAVFGSDYGVFIDQIDGVDNTDTHGWMLYVNGAIAEAGVSETLLLKTAAEIEFRFEEAPAGKHN